MLMRRMRVLLSLLFLGCGTPETRATNPVVPAPRASISASAAVSAGPAPEEAPSVETKRIPSRGLLEDVALLRKTYESLHPGLYRYNTPAQMAEHFKTLEAEFSRDRTLAEAYLAFSVFLAKVKCGHSYANFYNQSKPVKTALFEHQDRLPFHFRWINKRMIVTQDFSGHALIDPGVEILAINGTKADVIFDRLMTITRADGSNDDKRVSQLEVRGFDEWETFDIFFPLFFPPQSTTYTLDIRLRDGTTSNVQVTALTQQERENSRRGQKEAIKWEELTWKVEYPERGLAVLRVPTFALYNSRWDWKKFLDTTFAEFPARGIKNLIIDIRGNEGGIDTAGYFASKLSAEPMEIDPYERRVRYQKIPDGIGRYLDTWDPSFKDWGSDAYDFKDGFFKLKGENAQKLANAPKTTKPFRGKTFLLIDAVNSSASFQLAQVFKINKLATLVGMPTGGNQRGINGGAFFFLRLPNSGIEIDVPLIGRFPPKEAPDAGIEPDVRVEPTIDDIASGTDAEMVAVKKLIR